MSKSSVFYLLVVVIGVLGIVCTACSAKDAKTDTEKAEKSGTPALETAAPTQNTVNSVENIDSPATVSTELAGVDVAKADAKADGYAAQDGATNQEPTVPADEMAGTRLAAQSGNVAAQYALAESFEKAQDNAQAVYWYGRAAEQSADPVADAYASNDKPDQINKAQQALDWLKTAAGNGNALAQTTLGNMAARGRGLKQDYKQATEWLDKAAALKEPSALFALADLQLRGKGMEANEEKALELLKQAAELGDGPASLALSSVYGLDAAAPSDMEAAVAAMVARAQYGNTIAQTAMGSFHQNGGKPGLNQDLIEAHAWYELAASGENRKAAELRDALASGFNATQLDQAEKLVEKKRQSFK